MSPHRDDLDAWQDELQDFGPLPLSPNVDEAWADIRARAVTGAPQPAIRTTRPAKPRRTRTIAQWVAGVSAVGVIVAVGIQMSHHTPHGAGAGAAAAHDYVTAMGHQLAVTLVDGTQVRLAPASHLHVAAGYGTAGQGRTLDLEGEGYFSVRHDATRPFTVRTRGVVTRDIGTVFDVQAYPSDAATRIAVATGAVDVCAAGETITATCSTELYAGDMAIVANTHIQIARGGDVLPYTAWVQGRLVFRDTPLPEVIRQLDRAFDLDIIVADSDLARQTVTASFANFSPEQVLAAVAHTVGAHYDRHGRTVVLRRGHTGGPLARDTLVPALTTTQANAAVTIVHLLSPSIPQ